MMHPRFKNAYLKLDNAAQHIAKVNKLLRDQRPFTYVLETDTQARQRSTFAKKNEAVIDTLSVVIGDVCFNIRAALDYGYWQVVYPFVPEPKQKAIQFPSAKEANQLDETIKNRFAHFVSDAFFNEIVALQPHGGDGGNKLLYVLEKAATPDRHRDLTPIGDYTRISSDMIRRQVPDFPRGFVNCGFGSCRRDVTWPLGSIDPLSFGELQPPTFFIFDKELAVPVDAFVVIAETNYHGPLVPTLNELFSLVKKILTILERYA